MIPAIAFTLLTVQVLLLAGCAVMLLRNWLVHRYSMALLRRLHEIADDECARGNYGAWSRRLDAMNEVPYERKVLLFWRPLDSFYRGTILEDIARDVTRTMAQGARPAHRRRQTQ